MSRFQQFSGNAFPQGAAQAVAGARGAFIRRTYAHLAGAIGLFILLAPARWA